MEFGDRVCVGKIAQADQLAETLTPVQLLVPFYDRGRGRALRSAGLGLAGATRRARSARNARPRSGGGGKSTL